MNRKGMDSLKGSHGFDRFFGGSFPSLRTGSREPGVLFTDMLGRKGGICAKLPMLKHTQNLGENRGRLCFEDTLQPCLPREQGFKGRLAHFHALVRLNSLIEAILRLQKATRGEPPVRLG